MDPHGSGRRRRALSLDSNAGSDDGDEAWSEARTLNGWATMFKLAMKRTD
jgi:hypothetical protein